MSRNSISGCEAEYSVSIAEEEIVSCLRELVGELKQPLLNLHEKEKLIVKAENLMDSLELLKQEKEIFKWKVKDDLQ